MNFKIGPDIIGDLYKTYIVAEISSNHKNNINKIKELISESKEIGVNAVKIQTYCADSITINSNKKDFLIPNYSKWSKYKNLYNLYEKASLPYEWYDEIFEHAKNQKITIFSSPFSLNDLEFLKKFNLPAYKIASAEINYLELIDEVAKKKKPIILSTGMAELKDINLALETIKKKGNKKIILLLCNSDYPTKYENFNLNGLKFLKDKFKVLIGISDHSLGNVIPISAVSLGAKFIEKHIKLTGDNTSPDHFFSMNTREFGEMIKDIRNIEKSFSRKSLNFKNKNFRSRRSIYVLKDIKKNETFSRDNLGIKRPAFSLNPNKLNLLLGKKSNKNLKKGDRVKIEYIKKINSQ